MENKWPKWTKSRDKLSSVSSEFLEVVKNLDPNDSEQPGVCGHWSPKDVVSHIIGWERETVKQFDLFLKGTPTNIKYDIDSFNQNSVESRKHLSWNDVIEELTSAQRELRQINDTIVEENIMTEKRFLLWANTLIRHYRHHMSQLKVLTK